MAIPEPSIVRQVHDVVDALNQYNELNPRALKKVQAKGFHRAFAKTIIQGVKPRLAGYQFLLVKYRSLSGRDISGILPINQRIRPRRTLKVFVGHRFTNRMKRSLRHNLQLVFQPYGIQLIYSDTDMLNGPVFSIIVDRIKKSDFCVFDDRETEIHPNVLIELGATIALGRPYFYFNFQRKRPVRLGRKKVQVTTPSDLDGMLYLGYSDCLKLAAELSVKLPQFLVQRKLARIVAS